MQRFGDSVRLLTVNKRATWPVADRMAFYAYGTYSAKLEPGEYSLIVYRGPEYKVYVGKFLISEDTGPTEVTVSLKRYDDLASRGWISGDGHIHLQREEVADQRVWQQIAAEDVHVADLLQMGNITGIYFEQPAWGQEGRYTYEGHSLVSGQEDPRTGQLGHTVHTNLQQPIHLSSESYFLYYKAFNEAHRQGGISGYAHLGEWFNAPRGLAIDVPFGDVDFISVAEMGRISVDIWYRYLNMGYKILPAAGSDFPYTDLPGVQRHYVKTGKNASLDDYYRAWQAGRIFVTNGPFLEFTVDGQEMGSEVHVGKGRMVQVHAEAWLNPDVDSLDRLELISHGKVIKTIEANGSDRVTLDMDIRADESQWLAVRAFGKQQAQFNTIGAHSAATYLIVDGASFWKRSALQELISDQQKILSEIMSSRILLDEDLEGFDTNDTLLAQWPKQRELLRSRVEEAEKAYDEILIRAGFKTR